MSPQEKPPLPPKNNNISISGDVRDSVVIIGDNNTINQTIIQKFFNIFKSDTETLEHRNRRILLGHVENAWIEGVLDASLHGAALLDLGIKQDPEAVTQYPWTLKKESTDETLPAGTSMLEIFESIGMGRSLLILGASGSGKTTMLLELARGLIARAREDVTQPIPMVFNLASWTEKLTLENWLAQELNNLYSVPRKTAPDWVKGNKLLLLLDGLDEVRQESRAKCVEAINAFRKDHGLTSLAVCSRSQDYADLNAKLSFEGAIEIQSLTKGQITEFFNRFGNEMAGIKQALEKDSDLREMAETPLFLSIMLLAYRDKQDVEILVSGDEKTRRKHLFDTYITRMFDHSRSKNSPFKTNDISKWLSWLAIKMVGHHAIPYMLEDMQPSWLGYQKNIRQYRIVVALILVLIAGIVGLFAGLLGGLWIGLAAGLVCGLMISLTSGTIILKEKISIPDSMTWDRVYVILGVISLLCAVFLGAISGLLSNRLLEGIGAGLGAGLLLVILFLVLGLNARRVIEVKHINQRLFRAKNISLIALVSFGSSIGMIFGLIFGLSLGFRQGVIFGSSFGLISGLVLGLFFGGFSIIQHIALRFLLIIYNLLPWRLVPFLDHCVDLIFLRRVGGGYIFIHRLLMEHFAEMYVETPTSKGNQK
jgi:MFS family permease